MDSFFSLFDPTDGAGKSNNKDKDPPKGRRRGRKCTGKSETLPEESSFLCEPELSTELLVKDGSYIESYIEVNHRDDKSEADMNKVRRRNSGRKNRRRKSKISPAKENTWTDGETSPTDGVSVKTEKSASKIEKPESQKNYWNNRSSISKHNDDNIGKNVNDLRKEKSQSREKDTYYKKDRSQSREKVRDYKKGRSQSRENDRDYKREISQSTEKDRHFQKDRSQSRDKERDYKKERSQNKEHYKKSKRKSIDSSSDAPERKTVYNVIDRLEKVGLKDNMYLAGDFNTDDLNDGFYSSEVDESFDDTASEGDGSAEETYGSLPPEPRFGNVEYKLQLVAVCEKRLQHLVTQLKWRLRSGGGSAVYLLGVRDCGALHGLRAGALRASLQTLRVMASALRAELQHVTARRVASDRAVAEVYIRKLAPSQQSVELRVAVMGANEAGKSTLIGVLTQGELDNGRGSARLNMFRHLHEVKSGRTSSLSHEILGFDAQGNVVNYGCSELMTAERIGERSAKLVSFLDLAGHSKYQRTTLHGLSGYCPHEAMLVISATAGITPITEEHIGILLALDLPFFCVITKCELAPTASTVLTARLGEILDTAGKKPLLITNENLARNCVAPQKLILDTVDICTDIDNKTGIDNNDSAVEGVASGASETDDAPRPLVPVFPVSCVRGAGLNALHAYLLALQPPDRGVAVNTDDETCEFQIDEIFHVGDTSGPVVGGLLAKGQLYEGDNLIIGPLESGSFERISVRSIYRNRVPCDSVRAGQSASLGLSTRPQVIRPGMVLLSVPANYQRGDQRRPTFGGCDNACHRDKPPSSLQPSPPKADNSKNSKNFRRKNKNIIQDLAKVEESLVKIDNIEDSNLYTSDNEDNNKKIIKKDINTDKISDIHDINDDIHDVPDINGNTSKNIEKDIIHKQRHVKENYRIVGENVHEDFSDKNVEKIGENGEKVLEDCICRDEVYLEDPNDPRGCMFFQATIHVLRHSTAICPGFQCTVHVGNVRQTAIIEGILSPGSMLRCGETSSCVFRFTRCAEYLVRGRRVLLTAGLGTRAIGRITQIFPYVP